MMLPKKRKPTHPGRILFEEFLKPLNITPLQFADLLGEGWTEDKVNALIAGLTPFSDKWAEKFAELLGTTPSLWRHLQSHYHEWESLHKNHEKGSLKPWKKAI